MDQDEHERIAREMRERAGMGEADVWLSTEVMRAIYGRGSIGTIPRMHVPACVIWTEKGPKIIVRAGAVDVNFLVAHELGHVALRLVHWQGTRDDEESAANAVGAAILAPPTAVRRAHAFYGEKLRPLASCFSISQTSMNLRLGEVIGDDRAVVTKTPRVLKRGWATVDDQLLIQWKAEPPPPGIAKVALAGKLDEGRVAFRKKNRK
jgi:hypothetical protein